MTVTNSECFWVPYERNVTVSGARESDPIHMAVDGMTLNTLVNQ
jgi:hypothetical protein